MKCSDLFTMLSPAGRSIILVGDAARLLALLIRARTHIFPFGWLELQSVLPYRAASYSLYVTATAIVRGILGGWARRVRRAAYRFAPAAALPPPARIGLLDRPEEDSP